MTELTEKQRVLVEHLRAAEAQRMSIAAYSRMHGVNAFSLYACRRRMARSAFVRVRVAEAVGTLMPIQARLPNGVSIAFQLDRTAMPAVLAALAAPVMFSFAPDAQVYLHRTPIDFRKQIDGLAMLVQCSLRLDPMQEALFVFTNRHRDRIKILWWDRNGFCLRSKRLEQQRFVWPNGSRDEVIEMNGELLAWLLQGFDVFRFPPHQRLRYGAVA